MDWLDILKTLIPGAITAVLAAVITVRLAFKRATQEKWWEKKYEAYASLLEALHHLKNYAAEHYESKLTHGQIPEEKMKELLDDWKRFSREMNKLSDLAAFRLSPESASILDEYQKEKREARESNDVLNWIEGDLEATKKCLSRLTVSAKRDLHIK